MFTIWVSKAKYVRINSLVKYIDLAIDSAIEIDYNMSQYLISTYGVTTWKEEYYRSIDKYKSWWLSILALNKISSIGLSDDFRTMFLNTYNIMDVFWIWN